MGSKAERLAASIFRPDYPPKADIVDAFWDFRFVPIPDSCNAAINRLARWDAAFWYDEAQAWEKAMTRPMPHAIEVLEAGLRSKLHVGAQFFVALSDVTEVDTGLGLSAPEKPMNADSMMTWLSCSKIARFALRSMKTSSSFRNVGVITVNSHCGIAEPRMSRMGSNPEKLRLCNVFRLAPESGPDSGHRGRLTSAKLRHQPNYSITSWARASGAKRQSAERAVVDGRVRSSPYTPCGIHRDAGVLARRNERSLRKLQERVLRK
jgi:hypothetical protein